MQSVRMLVCLMWASTIFCVGQSRPDASVLYSGADVVFTGRLERLDSTSNDLSGQFERELLIKGQEFSLKTLLVHLPFQLECHKFEERHIYLIYAHKIGNQLWADPCDSKLKSQAEADLKYLHTVNPAVSEECNPARVRQLAKKAPVVARAELVATEDSLPGAQRVFFRPWCGRVATTEDAYYKVLETLKGDISASKITVEHVICWDTVTVNGYYPDLSPELFKEGNTLLLFLNPGSNGERLQHVPPQEFPMVFEDVDENCGAIDANDEAALDLIHALRSDPQRFRSKGRVPGKH